MLRGARPVFVDVRPDTLNLDERLLAARIGPRTRAVVAVHYAGVGCEMDRILDIAGAARDTTHPSSSTPRSCAKRGRTAAGLSG
jgi:hypothetical protein